MINLSYQPVTSTPCHIVTSNVLWSQVDRLNKGSTIWMHHFYILLGSNVLSYLGCIISIQTVKLMTVLLLRDNHQPALDKLSPIIRCKNVLWKFLQKYCFFLWDKLLANFPKYVKFSHPDQRIAHINKKGAQEIVIKSQIS